MWINLPFLFMFVNSDNIFYSLTVIKSIKMCTCSLETLVKGSYLLLNSKALSILWSKYIQISVFSILSGVCKPSIRSDVVHHASFRITLHFWRCKRYPVHFIKVGHS